MRIALDGAPPHWVQAWDEQSLCLELGADTVRRGRSYAESRAVLELHIQEDGRQLFALVRGSRQHPYTVLISEDLGHWGSRCSCPMGADCKHVVAVLLFTREWLSSTTPPPATGWEAQLAPVLAPAAEPGDHAALALEVEVVPGGWAGTRVRLRPKVPGRNGGWIKTGTSWQDLETGYGKVRVRPSHRAAARALLAAWRGVQPPYVTGSYREPTIYVDELGRGAGQLLREARDAGVALIGNPPVQLPDTPATVVCQLSRTGSGAELATSVEWPDPAADGSPGGPHAQDEVFLIGDPAHSLVVVGPDRLVLAELDRPVDTVLRGLLVDQPLQILAADLPRFLTRYYPALRLRAPVISHDVELPDIHPPRLTLDVHHGPDHITQLRWGFDYAVGDRLLAVPLTGAAEVARDLDTERALVAQLPAGAPGVRVDPLGRTELADSVTVTGVEIARFLAGPLGELAGQSDVVVSVSGQAADYRESEQVPLIAVSTADAGDWFNLTVKVSVDGRDVPLIQLLQALARQQAEMVLEDGTWFRLDHPELVALRRLLDEARMLQDPAVKGFAVTPYQAGLWEELVGLGVVGEQSERWQRTVGALLHLEELPQPDPPAGLTATLRPYQLDGYRWLALLWDHQLGGVLADDMGLGKTVQALAMAVRAKEQGTLGAPLLVVAPTSVVATWAGEAARFAPGLRTVAITETERRSGTKVGDAADGADLVITSYALFRIDAEAYQGQAWSGLVLDEAQVVKNHRAKTYQCARRISAPFTLAITGTPLENSLMDLWSMLSIATPGLFPNPEHFTETYRRPIEAGHGTEQLSALRRRIRPVMLRRTKEQVLAELPPKIEQVLDVTLNPAHRKVYDTHLARERQRVLRLLADMDRNRITILASLTRMRQLCLAPGLVDADPTGKIAASKIDVLVEQLQAVAADGHRALVFSQFTGFLALVRQRLDAEGIGHCYLDGRTRNRAARVAAFREGSDPVFLISLKAGGVGLTLTEADYVYVLDPWWNPAAETQAVDRAHRIGQTRPVNVYRLVATDTIEEKVVALQQRKRDLFTRVVGDGSQVPSALTAADIRALFE